MNESSESEKSVRPDIILTPDSSNIVLLAYYEATGCVLVQFKTGKWYEYADVPRSTWVEIMHAPSKGTVVARLLRGRHAAVLLSEKDGRVKPLAAMPQTRAPAA